MFKHPFDILQNDVEHVLPHHVRVARRIGLVDDLRFSGHESILFVKMGSNVAVDGLVLQLDIVIELDRAELRVGNLCVPRILIVRVLNIIFFVLESDGTTQRIRFFRIEW